jgi:hypothetical protein
VIASYLSQRIDLGIISSCDVYSYLLTFHSHFLVVVAKFTGMALFFCAVYVGVIALTRLDNEDDYVDVE